MDVVRGRIYRLNLSPGVLLLQNIRGLELLVPGVACRVLSALAFIMFFGVHYVLIVLDLGDLLVFQVAVKHGV
jgi:hypothetical protein